jgi:1,2-diacylglycerol 3-beta-galactosyltransferase
MVYSGKPPQPLLFLIGDTGGGHRSAATAVAQAMELTLPGRFVPIIFDPVRGPDVSKRLRWFAGTYGPVIRVMPWLWWLFWKVSDLPPVLSMAQRWASGGVRDSITQAAKEHRPALIVSFHPVTGAAAVRARDRAGIDAPVVTVVTDLISAHRSWLDASVDRVVVPSEALAARCLREGIPADRRVLLGLPVAAQFCQPPLSEAERRELKRKLGVSGDFLVVLTGGGEGSGGLDRQAVAVLRHVKGVDVVVICGRNRGLERRVARLAARAGHGRLTAHGFVRNMPDWLRCADIVVGKAGPGTIAEATCSGAPLVLTSYVPGQEKGNAEYVTEAGAGLYAPSPRKLAAEIGRLRSDPVALAAMRDAAVKLSRPRAAADIARLLADMTPAPASLAHQVPRQSSPLEPSTITGGAPKGGRHKVSRPRVSRPKVSSSKVSRPKAGSPRARGPQPALPPAGRRLRVRGIKVRGLRVRRIRVRGLRVPRLRSRARAR